MFNVKRNKFMFNVKIHKLNHSQMNIQLLVKHVCL